MPKTMAAPDRHDLSAKGKHVVVIGGGDTGSDCIGTSNRQGAASVTQLEIMPQPPERENKAAGLAGLAAEAAHLVLARKRAASATSPCRPSAPSARTARSPALECVRVEWVGGRRRPDADAAKSPGSEFTLKADLVLLAMGFVGPRKAGLVEQAGVELDARGNVKANVGRLPDHRAARSSPAATCAAASRWWSGRSAKAASAPAPSTSS